MFFLNALAYAFSFLQIMYSIIQDIKKNWQNCSHLDIKKFFYKNYSLIQMKCQGGNKYALPITVKFDQSTGKFGRICFARLFKLTKHIALLFYLLLPYLLSFIRGSRNVRNNMHIIKTIMKFCVLYGMTNPDAGGIRAGGIRTQSALRFRCP